MDSRHKSNGGDNGLARALRYMHLAFVLPFSVVAGLILGGFANQWFGMTSLDRVGAILGLVAGIVEMTRMLLRIRRENK
jgi:hypothetical protein